MSDYKTDWQSAVEAAESAFNARYPVGAAVTLKPTEGTIQGAVQTRTAGAAYLAGREVKVLTTAASIAVNIQRIGEARA